MSASTVAPYVAKAAAAAQLVVTDAVDAGRCLVTPNKISKGHRIFVEFPALAASAQACAACNLPHESSADTETCGAYQTRFGGLGLGAALDAASSGSIKGIDPVALIITIQFVAARMRDAERRAVQAAKTKGKVSASLLQRQLLRDKETALSGAAWLRDSFADSKTGRPAAVHLAAAEVLARLIPRQVLTGAYSAAVDVEVSTDAGGKEQQTGTKRGDSDRSGIEIKSMGYTAVSASSNPTEWVAHIIGTICSNMHEGEIALPPAQVENSQPTRQFFTFGGVFPLAAVMEHRCRANCNFHVQPSGEICVSALRDIDAGERLSIDYGVVYLPTKARRAYLLEHYRFFCRCDMCDGGEDKARSFVCRSCARRQLPRGSTPSTSPQAESSGIVFPLGVGSDTNISQWRCTKGANDTDGSHVTEEDVKVYLAAERDVELLPPKTVDVIACVAAGVLNEAHFVLFRAMREQLPGLSSADAITERFVTAIRHGADFVLSENDPFKAQFYRNEHQLWKARENVELAERALVRAEELESIAGARNSSINSDTRLQDGITAPATDSMMSVTNNETALKSRRRKKGGKRK